VLVHEVGERLPLMGSLLFVVVSIQRGGERGTFVQDGYDERGDHGDEGLDLGGAFLVRTVFPREVCEVVLKI